METPKIDRIKDHFERHPDVSPGYKCSHWNKAEHGPKIRAGYKGLPQLVDVLKHAQLPYLIFCSQNTHINKVEYFLYKPILKVSEDCSLGSLSATARPFRSSSFSPALIPIL